jgi:hypothetical protein
MRKKILCLILSALILCTGAMTGCNNGMNNKNSTEATEMQKKRDGILNLLMIGSSYCYYYVEELYDLLMANPPEGITEVNVYNLYYSGCRLTQHHIWWQQGEAHYDFYRVDATGRKRVDGYDKWSLDQGLAMADWDYISLQGTPSGFNLRCDDPYEISVASVPLAEALFDYIHEEFPSAKLFWHWSWFKEVGRIDTSGHIYTAEEGPLYNTAMEQISRYICQEVPKDKSYELTMVPTGLAWTKARQKNETADLLPYGGLCARLGKNMFGDLREHSGDGTHDGDIGGGQYLNACVWYEIITGNDCRDVNYVPTYVHNGVTYTVDGQLRSMLNEAAHEAVAEVYPK